jgi:hypothetical protein
MGVKRVVVQVKRFGFWIQNTRILNLPLATVNVNHNRETVMLLVPNHVKGTRGKTRVSVYVKNTTQREMSKRLY